MGVLNHGIVRSVAAVGIGREALKNQVRSYYPQTVFQDFTPSEELGADIVYSNLFLGCSYNSTE